MLQGFVGKIREFRVHDSNMNTGAVGCVADYSHPERSRSKGFEFRAEINSSLPFVGKDITKVII